jgi:hypothetical protein
LEVREELLTIAEIAIGIAGFSGVIAVFLQRDGLHELDRVRFINLFATAFTTLALSYVPIVVSHLAAEPEQIWRYSGGVMIVVWFVGSSLSYKRVFPTIRKHISDRTLPFSLLVIPAVMNLGIQIFNLGGWLWEPQFLAYLFGLFAYLYAAGLMFVYVILYRPHDGIL